MLALGFMVCYNANEILVHNPIFQLDVCSILPKHPLRGQRQFICPSWYAGRLCWQAPLTGTATVHAQVQQGHYRPQPKHPLRGQRHLMAGECSYDAILDVKHPSRGRRHLISPVLRSSWGAPRKHPSRGRAAYFLLRFADFCGAPRQAFAKIGARRQQQLAASAAGGASLLLPLTGTHLPSPITMGEGFFVPKNQQPRP